MAFCGDLCAFCLVGGADLRGLREYVKQNKQIGVLLSLAARTLSLTFFVDIKISMRSLCSISAAYYTTEQVKSNGYN